MLFPESVLAHAIEPRRISHPNFLASLKRWREREDRRQLVGAAFLRGGRAHDVPLRSGSFGGIKLPVGAGRQDPWKSFSDQMEIGKIFSINLAASPELVDGFVDDVGRWIAQMLFVGGRSSILPLFSQPVDDLLDDGGAQQAARCLAVG